MDISNRIVETITIDNYEKYDIPEIYKELIQSGVISSIQVEKKTLNEVNVQDTLKLEEYRKRRRDRRRRKRKEEIEMKKKGIVGLF
jgi:MoaA/NifB/PqqE/SkfB family radical SAM enzyme